MTIEESLKNARDGVSLVGEVIKAAGDNPDVREAASNLGQTAVTLTKTINNALLPLAAINFAFDKARAYFAGQFQQDLAGRASAIPQEQIIEPKASIAGPALQGLAFTHEEANLKEMYLSLLATSMDGRVAADAHPAFVEIIRQLSSEEAGLIRGALQSLSAIPIVEVRLTTVGQKGWHVLATHLLNLTDTESKQPTENSRIPAMVDNWLRLGLVDVDYSKHLMDESSYAWVEQRPEVVRYRQVHENEQTKLRFANGVIQRTALGIQFAKAVGLSSEG
jgi:hypothetical protein